MPTPFVEIVKSQRVDGKRPAQRWLDARNLTTLAHRMRTQTLTYRAPTRWQRFVHWLRKLLRR